MTQGHLDPKFKGVEDSLAQIKQANDDFGLRLLTFFTLKGALVNEDNELSRHILEVSVSLAYILLSVGRSTGISHHRPNPLRTVTLSLMLIRS